MKRLWSLIVEYVDSKVAEQRAWQNVEEARLFPAAPAPAAVQRQPTGPRRRISLWVLLVGVALVMFWGLTPSCHPRQHAQMVQAPEPESPQGVGGFVGPTQQRTAQEARASKLNPPAAASTASGMPPCGPELANRVWATEPHGNIPPQNFICVWQDMKGQWGWAPETMPIPPGGQTASYQQGGQAQQQPEKTPVQKFIEDRQKRYLDSLSSPQLIAAAETSQPMRETTEERSETNRPDSETPSERDKSYENETSDPLNRKEYEYNNASGPFHIIQAGEGFEVMLDTAIRGESGGVVVAHLTHPLYVKNSEPPILLAPQGTRVVGTATAVSSAGAKGQIVHFTRMIFNDGYVLKLADEIAANQDGGAGLVDKVNNHTLQLLATAGLVGVIGGVAQIGNTVGAAGYSPSAGFRTGFTEQMGQESMQILGHKLGQLPELYNNPGKRCWVQASEDVSNVPEFANHHMEGKL